MILKVLSEYSKDHYHTQGKLLLKFINVTPFFSSLVVTRSIGDSVATRLGVTSEPEITTHTITPNDAFIVLASDGVWDGTSTERVVELVSKNVKDPEKASKSITENSLKGLNDSALDDNTTNIVLIFQENK